MQDFSAVTVVLPSLDPDEKLLATVEGLLEYGFSDIILVDDGSKPENQHYFTAAAAYPQVQLLRHPVNRGKGAALKTAFAWFLENRPESAGVITVDGDGQHSPKDIQVCARVMLATGKVILGCRDFKQPHVPARSRFGNRLTCGVFRMLCGMKLSDTQTGLRAIPTKAVRVLRKVEGNRFEYETNMLLAIKRRRIPYGEVKISTVYIEENKSSHFRPIQDSIRIYRLILAHFFRYTLSSVVSAVLDVGLFSLLSWLLRSASGLVLTTVPFLVARCISSLFNFVVNKQLVFRSGVKTSKALGRYYTLAVPIFLLQLGLTDGLFWLFSVGEDQVVLKTVLYSIVMAVLYLVSFSVQQRWVFADQKTEAGKDKITAKEVGAVAKGIWRRVRTPFFTILRRTFLTLGTVLLMAVIALCIVLNMIFNGPSDAARRVLTTSLHEASATKWVPALFIGQERVDQILYAQDDSVVQLEGVTDEEKIDSIKDAILDGIQNPDNDEWKDYPDGVRIEKVSGDTFNAYVMIIRDPSKVYLATSSDKFSKDIPGTRITDQIEKEGAIAAINAGAFFDNGTSSSAVGSVPEGLVLSGGKVVWNSGSAPEKGFVGFNQDNVLIVAESMTASKAMDMGIRDGCCFGPVLVMNGKINEVEYNSNSGYNPRTAIGQRADGAVIFVCIDGRQASSLGGTYADIIDIMVEFGAVNACNLDGGSSTVMLYRDQQGLYGPAGQVQMINNYSLLQEKPRRMPTFFMVAPAKEG